MDASLSPRRPIALYAALKFVTGSTVLSEHKTIVIDVLLQALRDEDVTELHRQEAAQEFREWRDDEIALLGVLLKDRVAKNWQDADESVMHLATQLHRDPRSVREKATEIGFGASVDYTITKTCRRQEPGR